MSAVLNIAHRPGDAERDQPRILGADAYLLSDRTLGGIRIEPYAPVLGGVVRGFNLSDEPVGADVRQFLYQSLLHFGFLSFEPGSIPAGQFEHFAGLFGTPRFAGNPQAPRTKGEVNSIDSSHKKTRTNYIWHIDQAYREQPQKFTALHALAAPARGGATLFSNAVAAYRLLDPALAAYFDTLSVIHNGDMMGLIAMSYDDPQRLAQARLEAPPLQVPLVRIHPETGGRQLFACELYAQRVLGVPRVVSDHILGIVFDYIRSPEVCTDYVWEEGATLIWDNRIMQHRGIFNYGGGQRVLHRAVIN